MRTLATIARRFAVVCTLGLWLGGTTLYTGFVISIGHRHVSVSEFGLVTEEVTRALNWIGVVAVAILTWNSWPDKKSPGRRLFWGLWVTYGLLMVSLLVLFQIHDRLVWILHRPMSRSIPPNFDFWHEGYQLVTAIQWGAGLLHLWFAIMAWRRADQEK